MVDQSQLYDYGNGYLHNYDSLTGAQAVSAFNSSAKIVWTFDDQISVPYADSSIPNLGNFSTYLGDLTYTKAGSYGSLLSAYSSDLDISIVDTGIAARFITDGGDLSDHLISAGGGSNLDQLLTITFSENVAAFAISYTVIRGFDVTVYDAAVGGNVIGTFSTSGASGNTNLVWSAIEAGASQGIGRVEFDRIGDDGGTLGDYRFSQLGFIVIPEPSTSAAIAGLFSLSMLLCMRRQRRA